MKLWFLNLRLWSWVRCSIFYKKSQMYMVKTECLLRINEETVLSIGQLVADQRIHWIVWTRNANDVENSWLNPLISAKTVASHAQWRRMDDDVKARISHIWHNVMHTGIPNEFVHICPVCLRFPDKRYQKCSTWRSSIIWVTCTICWHPPLFSLECRRILSPALYAADAIE